MTAGVITVSDKGSRGERDDISGREIIRVLQEMSATVIEYEVIPDEKEIIKQKLTEYTDGKKLDLVITTGGTGVSPRDLTPDATLEIIEKEIPGMAEVMRRESGAKTPHAMISRAIVGIRGQSLIINLPGSPKGAVENLSFIIPALEHAIDKIKGDETDCGL
ncbi:MAG: MogA/MoaB family molybdenum cofactor biosynthesis protein [Deltaproteobacteria bacterium]|nr:MogA/MoaB family molybdenum cofactor biosynthesis protein [Deltaproteobacteria bacterium]MBN2845933.1 MogA/MoaB family molybdenum cofactor biosynthesis protein [Deltaproteobacteria bacterium]